MHGAQRLIATCVAVALTLTLGCTKLNHERVLEIQPGQVKSVIIEPISKKQTVKVKITSVGTPVTVALIAGGDLQAATDQLADGKKPANAAEYKANFENDFFTVPVPENTEFNVLVTANKKATVTVKVTN
jgi:hypothetical protein